MEQACGRAGQRKNSCLTCWGDFDTSTVQVGVDKEKVCLTSIVSDVPTSPDGLRDGNLQTRASQS
jgi:hypothetical protein